MPVSGARDIEATLDGKARSTVDRAGWKDWARSRYRRPEVMCSSIRRSFATRNEAGVESLDFPVNALSSARVVVDPPAGGEQAPVLAASGGTQLQADGTASWPAWSCGSELSFAGIEARRQGTGKRRRRVEGLILWDINPAGDRIRTQADLSITGRASVLAALASGRVDSSLCPSAWFCRVSSGARTPGKDEWTLHVDPPLEAGETIELDCWMPLEASLALAAKPGDRREPGGRPCARSRGRSADRSRAL